MVSDGSLSQEEIDALLSIGNDDTPVDSPENEYKADVRDYLSTIEIDTIGEIGNISIGSSATTLSTLLNQKVNITTPRVSIVKKAELNEEFSEEHVNVKVNYVEGFSGENVFVVKSQDAAIISNIMLGGDGTNPDTELTEIHLSAVQEVMNQMMGTAATSMSTIFNKRVNISPPSIEIKEAYGDQNFVDEIDEEIFVKVSFQLEVGTLIDSSIMQLIPFPFAYDLVEELLEVSNMEDMKKANAADETLQEEQLVAQNDVESPRVGKEQQEVQSVENEPRHPQILGTHADQQHANVQTASFSSFEEVPLSENEHRNLDMLLDVPLKVTVELGRTNRPIREILDLSPGSIVELDKLAGEPVDILVNEKLIAKGEVVVIDENFGVRVTDIVSKTDRIKSLQ
ncbi:MAG TPA: flagellar motor switch phosphatase FliY [Bacillota bacterium]|nr:flagellar motor switch phosphatase FliY [Bacillota bacterium]